MRLMRELLQEAIDEMERASARRHKARVPVETGRQETEGGEDQGDGAGADTQGVVVPPPHLRKGEQ